MNDDDLSIPAFLVRKDTPESRAERERLNDELRGGYRRAAKVRPTVSAGLSETNSKETKMAKIGKKEQALRDTRKGGGLKVIAKTLGGLLDPNKTAGGDVALPGKGKPPKAKVSDVTEISWAEMTGEDLRKPKPKTTDEKVAVDLAALTGVVEKNAKPEPKVRVVEKKEPKVSEAAKDAASKAYDKERQVAARKAAAAATKPAGKPAAKAKGVTPAAAKKLPAKPAKAKSGEPWPKPGTKQAAMLDMVKRKEGASEKAICKKLGWKKCRVTLGRVVKAAGFKLEHERIDDETVYYAK